MKRSGTGRRARLRRRHPTLYPAGIAALVLGVIAIVVVADPLAAIVSALPRPDLPGPDIPDLPGWATWLRRGILIGLVVLAVVGEIERARKHDRSTSGDEEPT